MSFETILNSGVISIFIPFFLVAVGFLFGWWFQRQKSHVSALIHEAKFKAGQIDKLEKANKDLAATTRALSSKEFELINANRRLRDLENAKGKFVSVTTHQLRTPLAGIKWTFDMLQKEQLGPISPDQRQFIDKGVVSTQKMIQIVNDLLHINLSEDTSADTLTIEPVDISALVEEVAAEFFSPAESKKINLTVSKPAGALPPVMADRGKIKMSLENLVDNAIKYTPKAGQVTVTVDDKNLNSANPTMELSVRDSGIGISKADQHKIFQKFFRSTGAVAVEPDGSGLGLYIVKDIIEKHQGSIWFESETGQGTTFYLSLPLKQK
ncbi:MAG: HAMP domain-containing sensor histidine kinase [Candidatus Paceibacterota bacterium]|jgi:signal transduction histidine kinase